jgi:hypothetical protein
VLQLLLVAQRRQRAGQCDRVHRVLEPCLPPDWKRRLAAAVRLNAELSHRDDGFDVRLCTL